MNRSQLFILIGVGALTSSFLYWYLKSKRHNTHKKQFEISDFDDAMVRNSISEIKQRLTDKPLHSQEGMIEYIFRKSSELIKPQYVQLIQHYRNQRRSLTQPADQIESIVEQESKLKILKDNSLNCILAGLDISEDTWSMEVMTWLTPQRNQEWEELLADMAESLTEALPVHNKEVTKKNLHNIFRHHIKFLEQLDRKKYDLNSRPQEDIIGIVNQLVSDELYKKFKLENEHIKHALNNLSEEDYKQFENHLEEIANLNATFVVSDDQVQS